MKTTEPFTDIFGIAMFSTQRARLHEFSRMVSVLSRIGLYNPQKSFWKLRFYVEVGLLSPQSASYFFAGRASSFQVALLDSCVSLIQDWKQSEVIKFLNSWQKTKVGKVENTFLFPLAELASNDSFEAETACYRNQDVKDLQKL